jgi:hypothetical protein
MRFTMIAIFAIGCGSSGEAPDAAIPNGSDAAPFVPLCTDDQIGDAGVPATFVHVQRIFNESCASCHCCSDPLLLTTGMAYAQIVNRKAPSSAAGIDESCGGVLVKPGDPDASYLYQKISTTSPCAGQPMPRAEFQLSPLQECEQDLVRRWILAGAPDD